MVRQLVEEGLGLLGDDQGVAPGERPDVEEGEDVVVLVDLVAGDLAGDDLVEDGAHAAYCIDFHPTPPGSRAAAILE